jgi:hypothetical protein
MKTYRFLVLSVILLFAYSKGADINRAKPVQNLFTPAQRYVLKNEIMHVHLENGLDIKAKKVEDTDNLKTFSNLSLLVGSTEVWQDSGSEYEMSKETPIYFRHIGDENIEIIFVINDRPLKNKYRRIIVLNNKVVKNDSLPLFESVNY